MTLDQRADAATRELLATTDVDVRRGLAELRSTRRRRDTGRRAGAALVAVALVGATAWVAARPDDGGRPEPAPAPDAVSNGALVGLPDAGDSPGSWRVLAGPAVAHLPPATTSRHELQFTADGTSAVTVDRRDRVLEVDVTTGTTAVVGTCPDDLCTVALSPDGSTFAWSDRDGLLLEPSGGGARLLDLGAGAGMPSWSPDGESLVFVGEDGVQVVATDGTGRTTVYATPGDAVAMAPQYSPDGAHLAFLEGVPRAGSTDGEYDWAVVVVGVDGTGAQRVREAGHCACLGLPVPSLAWSPDGTSLAVATTQGAEPGVHVVRPDGTGDRLVAPGYFADVAWQPLVG